MYIEQSRVCIEQSCVFIEQSCILNNHVCVLIRTICANTSSPRLAETTYSTTTCALNRNRQSSRRGRGQSLHTSGLTACHCRPAGSWRRAPLRSMNRGNLHDMTDDILKLLYEGVGNLSRTASFCCALHISHMQTACVSARHSE